MRLALFQPDIPQNTGTIMRLAACFGVRLEIIEPCGFILSDSRLKRAGLDYADRAVVTRYPSWDAFMSEDCGRLILMTTMGTVSLADFHFESNDRILFGAESSGAPPHVHEASDNRVRVPMRDGMRSLNVAVCAGIVLWEALRQTSG